MWPRGGTDIVQAELTAAKVATLLTGDNRWAELPRSQMAVLRKQGEVRDGRSMVPIRHDHRGWYHFVEEPADPYINLWFLSHDEQDWKEIQRLAEMEKSVGGRITDPDLEWAYFVKGLNPGYPERALSRDLAAIARKVEQIQNERGYSETWVDNKWSNMDPMVVENLTRFSVGGIPVQIRGEMLHSQLRYFDGQGRRPGLPADVSALVSRIERDWVEVELVNLNVTESRQLVIQGGAYGEHRTIFSGSNLIKLPIVGLEVNVATGSEIKIRSPRPKPVRTLAESPLRCIWNRGRAQLFVFTSGATLINSAMLFHGIGKHENTDCLSAGGHINLSGRFRTNGLSRPRRDSSDRASSH